MNCQNKRIKKNVAEAKAGESGFCFRYFFLVPVLFTPLQFTLLKLYSIVHLYKRNNRKKSIEIKNCHF